MTGSSVIERILVLRQKKRTICSRCRRRIELREVWFSVNSTLRAAEEITERVGGTCPKETMMSETVQRRTRESFPPKVPRSVAK
jgi:hypothetical protein